MGLTWSDHLIAKKDVQTSINPAAVSKTLTAGFFVFDAILMYMCNL